MDVKQLRKQSEIDWKTGVRFYNPMTTNLEFTLFGEEYSIPALEISKFPKPVAEHAIKILVNLLVYTEGFAKDEAEKRVREIEI